MKQFDLVAHLTRQMVFSRATFGPGTRTEGVLRHLEKEIAEVRMAESVPDQIAEWVDLVILSLDGLTRAIWLDNPYKNADHAAESACELISQKQGRNERRNWPDYRTLTQGDAIEHDRTKGVQ